MTQIPTFWYEFDCSSNKSNRIDFETKIESKAKNETKNKTKANAKAQAKANRSDSLLGNRIDKLVRNGQDGQTLGIPIGPDTSLVIAELILTAVDQDLQSRHPGLQGIRYIDDYEFAFDQTSRCDLLLGAIQECLNEYELSLNPRKTSIAELPQEVDSPWTHDIRRFRFRRGEHAQRYDLLHYFDMVFDLIRRFPNAHIAEYALPRFYPDRGFGDIHGGNWPLLQSLVNQAMTVQAGAIPAGARVLLEHVAKGHLVDAELVRPTLEGLIKRHAPLGHASEVAWSLWTALAFDLSLSAYAAKLISGLGDSVVALLALDAAHRRRLDLGSLDLTKWQEYIDGEGLYGPQWLLAYEAPVKGWLTCATGDHIGADAAFLFLRENDVAFYTCVPGTAVDALDSLCGRMPPEAAVYYGEM